MAKASTKKFASWRKNEPGTAKKRMRDNLAIDVTVGDLFGKPKRSKFWQTVLLHLKQQWVDPYPHRMTDVRCGTAYFSNRSGTYGKEKKRWTSGRIVIELRFPLNLRLLEDVFDKLEAKYRKEWDAMIKRAENGKKKRAKRV